MKTLKETCRSEQTVKVEEAQQVPVRLKEESWIWESPRVLTYLRAQRLHRLGDPVEVTVRGYELSLRKADAEMIEVE